jgi:predicted solute-binding protein
MTGLPFVWAFWAGPETAADAEVVGILQAAAARGQGRRSAIAEAYCADRPDRVPLARRYLNDHMRFDLDARAIEGLRAYYREAAALGLARDRGPLRFFPEPRHGQHETDAGRVRQEDVR